MAKQTITFLKIQKFIRKYPIVLFYQHNNLSVKQWLNLRSSVKTLETCNILLVKNTLIQTVFLQETISDTQKFQAFFQGPCFAVGVSDFSQIETLGKILDSNFSLFLIGGLLNNQILTHLDIFKIKKLNKSIYSSFLTNLQQNNKIVHQLSSSGTTLHKNLTSISHNFLYCLEVFKHTLQNQEDIYCIIV